MNEIKTKDSGQRVNFETGARRDTDDGKPNPVKDLNSLVSYTYMQSGAWFVPRTHEDVVYPPPQDPEHQLIVDHFLDRLQALLERGAEKYGENNWERGIPLHRTYESLIRHAVYAMLGDNTEDHLAAVAANVMFAMEIERRIEAGEFTRDEVKYLATAGVPKIMLTWLGVDYYERQGES